MYPERLIGNTAYGSAEMLNWLVHDRGIEPHIPVYDKSQRTDGILPLPGRKNPPALSPAVHDAADRSAERQPAPLPGEQA